VSYVSILIATKTTHECMWLHHNQFALLTLNFVLFNLV
jgi:hypothetical protein